MQGRVTINNNVIRIKEPPVITGLLSLTETENMIGGLLYTVFTLHTFAPSFT